jgi:hypothetical protein
LAADDMAGGQRSRAHFWVDSLARRGGNITGLYYRQPELAVKQLELLVEAAAGRGDLDYLPLVAVQMPT